MAEPKAHIILWWMLYLEHLALKFIPCHYLMLWFSMFPSSLCLASSGAGVAGLQRGSVAWLTGVCSMVCVCPLGVPAGNLIFMGGGVTTPLLH